MKLMCQNMQCSLKRSCERFTAYPMPDQSYKDRVINSDGTCDYYVKDKV